MRTAWPRAIASAVALVALGLAATSAQAQGSQYTVVLEGPSAGKRLSLSRGKPGRGAPAPVAVASVATMARAVAREQTAVIASLEGLGVEVIGTVRHVLNAVFVRATREQAQAIALVPGVRSVVQSRQLDLELDSVPQVIGLDAERALLGDGRATGAGVKIGIIDSGLDLHHPAFRDDALPALPGYPRGRPAQLQFTSNKVIAVRTYLHLLNSGEPETSTPDDTSPHDASGHGTAVAMIAAGARTDSPAGPLQGVAPRAHLGVYKVSGTPGINTHPTSQAIIAALDDAVADGMDILNLSLGVPAQLPWNALGHDCGAQSPAVDCDPLAVAAQSAVVDYGRVVVAAAGNEGAQDPQGIPALNSILTPAIAPDVIAVAATWNSRELVQGVRAGSSAYPALAGSGPIVDGSLTAPLAVADGLGHPLGCTPFPAGSLLGEVVLVKRGTCLFEEKIENADAAGAAAVIVYNDRATDELVEMASIEDTDIPAYFISGPDGEALIEKARGPTPGAALAVTLEALLEAWDTDSTRLADFSSRGPSPGLNLKPDIAAPGAFVYTATARHAARPAPAGPGLFRQASGTSMAAPVVAGAAALVWEMHPRLTAREVASALINTASPSLLVNGERARATSAGAGLLDVAGALQPIATVEPPTVGFGPLSSSRLPVWQEILVTNRSSASHSYRMAVDGRDPDALASVTLDGFQDIQFELGPDEYVRIRVSLQGAVPLPGRYEGHLRLSRDSGGSDLLVPYLYVAGDGQATGAFPLTNGFEVGAAGERAGRRVAAKFVDQYGVPVVSLPVQFLVRDGNARIESAAPVTDAFGVARAVVNWGASSGAQTVVVSAGGMELPFRFEATGERPVIQSVYSSASYDPERPLAPGSLVGVFGSGFARFEGLSEPGRFPIALKSVSASFDFPELHLSFPAPVYYVRPDVIGLQVPWELAGLNFAHLKVRVGNGFGRDFASDPLILDLSDVSPGVFVLDTPEGPAPALQHPDGSPVSSSSPASPGGTVTIRMTGNGPRQREVATGSSSEGSNPLVHWPAVTVGGLPAQVVSAAADPSAVGTSRVQIVVPPDAPPGALELEVTVRGERSNVVRLPVQ